MNLHELVSQLIVDTKGLGPSFIEADSSLWAFMPEIILCLTIVALMLSRLLKLERMLPNFVLVMAGTIAALLAAAPWNHLGGGEANLLEPDTVSSMEIFTGMLVYDRFGVFVRSFLLLFALLFAVFTRLSGLPDREDGPDIYTLVLGATLGMCLMASANHLLMVFMAVEMASVPSYVLAGMLKGRKVGSEAALKYSVYGAGTAGVMLYGISLICGLTHSAHLPTIALQLSQQLPQMPLEQQMVLASGGLLIMVGLAFKLSAVPFHFWCPDVFEGATSEVAAFLSVASKAAALALLVRVAVGFGTLPPERFTPGERSMSSAVASLPPAGKQTDAPALFNVAEEANATEEAAHDPQHTAASEQGSAGSGPMASLAPVRHFLGNLIALLAAVTCTFGNLAAYGQTNIKRLLAYSTIAHAGYMMMALPPLMEMAGSDPVAAQLAVSSLAVYMAVYLFMNLGAFAIVAFLRNAMFSEEIADYAGLIRRCPIMVICFSLILFSLVGLPPLAGFLGKFAIFAALAEGFRSTGATYLLVLLLIGGINTVVSLFYYLRVVKVMTMEPEPQDRPPFVFSDVSLQGAYIWLLTLPTAIWILQCESLYLWAAQAAKYLLG